MRERFTKLETRQSADGRELWLNWVIRLPSSELIGYVQATVFPNGRAAIAYVLSSKHWGRGLAREAVQAMIAELVERYRVRTLSAALKRENHRSMRLLEHLGFTPASPELAAQLQVKSATFLQLREDHIHRRVISFVVRARADEHLIEHLEVSDLGNVEERLALFAALQLMSAQQFGSPYADPVALRFDKSRSPVVQKAQSLPLLNRPYEHLIHVNRRRSLSGLNAGYARSASNKRERRSLPQAFMQKYKNLSGRSGVIGYEVNSDSITVEFDDGSIYLYTHESAGRSNVEEMKVLATAGAGLATFIVRRVRMAYAAKLR